MGTLDDRVDAVDAAEHEALLSFLYLAPVGLVHFAGDGAVAMINPLSAQLLMPLAPDGALDNFYDVLGDALPDLRQRVAAHRGRHGRICDGLRIPLPGRDGRPPSVLALTLLRLDDASLMAVLSDVTEQARHERLLAQSQSVISAILTDIDDYALVTLDAAGHVAQWNESVGRVTGLEAADVEGRPFDAFDAPDAADADADADAACGSAWRAARRNERLRDADRDGWSLGEGWQRRADGTRFWGTTLIAPLDTSTGASRGYHYVVRNIDHRRSAAEDLLRSIHTDFLTGLANRRHFVESGERECARARRTAAPLSVVIFDCDHFKSVNDRHGHAGGDAVLRHVAAALRGAFRNGDVVARIGGEEFAVLLPGLDAPEAAAAAARLLEAVAAAPASVGDATLHQTLSAGVASLDADAATLDAVLVRADRALYAAKSAGRDTVRTWKGTLR